VSCEGENDRLICPICLASAEAEAARRDPVALKRGTPIDKELRFLVYKARFPRSSGSLLVPAVSADSGDASSATAGEKVLPPVLEKDLARQL